MKKGWSGFELMRKPFQRFSARWLSVTHGHICNDVTRTDSRLAGALGLALFHQPKAMRFGPFSFLGELSLGQNVQNTSVATWAMRGFFIFLMYIRAQFMMSVRENLNNAVL